VHPGFAAMHPRPAGTGLGIQLVGTRRNQVRRGSSWVGTRKPLGHCRPQSLPGSDRPTQLAGRQPCPGDLQRHPHPGQRPRRNPRPPLQPALPCRSVHPPAPALHAGDRHQNARHPNAWTPPAPRSAQDHLSAQSSATPGPRERPAGPSASTRAYPLRTQLEHAPNPAALADSGWRTRTMGLVVRCRTLVPLPAASPAHHEVQRLLPQGRRRQRSWMRCCLLRAPQSAGAALGDSGPPPPLPSASPAPGRATPPTGRKSGPHCSPRQLGCQLSGVDLGRDRRTLRPIAC